MIKINFGDEKLHFTLLSTPQFNTSVPHKDHTFLALSSTPKAPQFHTKNPSVPYQKPLSSTPKPLQFNIKKPSVPHLKPPQFNTTHTPSVELRGFWCGTEGCVELRGMRN